MIGAPQTSYFHHDAHGSPDVVTRRGAVVDRLKFEPFGQRRYATALAAPASVPTPGSLGFTGHEPDDDLGLTNMGGRLYDQRVGRFLTPDPLVQAPHFGQSLNRYSYVMNDPINSVDPSGHYAVGIIAFFTFAMSLFGTTFAVAGASGSGYSSYSPRSIPGPPGSRSGDGPAAAPPSQQAAASPAKPGWVETFAQPRGLLDPVADGAESMVDDALKYWKPDGQDPLKRAAYGVFKAGAGGVLSAVESVATVANPGRMIQTGARLFQSHGGGVDGADQTEAVLKTIDALNPASGVREKATHFADGVVEAITTGKTGALAEASGELLMVAVMAKVVPNEPKSTIKIPQDAVRVGDYTLSRTVENHLNAVNEAGKRAGLLERPYINSPGLIDQIVQSGPGRPDPGGVVGATRWDVRGTLGASTGTYQLVITDTNHVLHFVFEGDR